MGTAKPSRGFVLFLFLLFSALSVSSSSVPVEELSLVVGESSWLQLSPNLKVLDSPGIKQGTSVLCARVHVHGLPRLKNLNKHSHSLKVKVSIPGSSLSLRRPGVEVCFHRNASLGIGMCPQIKWEKVDKGSWVRAMSPFDHKLLDIRMLSTSTENVEVSIAEEFFLYRVVFFILGIFLLSMASAFSKSLVFYYGSAMVVGILLLVLVILFQGMKLLPTGRKSSLAIFLYSSVVGFGSFVLSYLPGLLRSVLIEMGISEDLYYPLGFFSLAFFVLAGAWMGFWAVRKLVLTEEGLVDVTTAMFVASSIRIVAALMIIQSSLDNLMAFGALITGVVVSVILRRIFRLKTWRRFYKKLSKLAKNMQTEQYVPDISPFGVPNGGYTFKSPEDSRSLQPQRKQFSLAQCNSPMQGFSRTPPGRLLDQDFYPSTYHKTPNRKKFSKEEWEMFTRDSTQKAIKELVSSPDFGKWAAANADRITVASNTPRTPVQQRRKWLFWSS